MTVFFLTFVIVGVAMLAMGIGAIFSNRCLRGSCGGPAVMGPDGQPLSCPTCSNKDKHSREAEETSAA
jgi:hypothetical protein